MENKSLIKLDDKEKDILVRKDWESERMVEFTKKRYDYYKTKDNVYIEVEKANSLAIVKEFYYDDEQEAPKINFDNFVLYNATVFNRYDWLKNRSESENIKWMFTKQFNHLANINTFTGWELKENKFGYTFVRELTQEEKQEYLEILNERNKQYLERLKKYFKRYGHLITTHGYWANR